MHLASIRMNQQQALACNFLFIFFCKFAANKTMIMNKVYLALYFFGIGFFGYAQNIFWTDDFSTPSNWAFSDVSLPQHGWTIGTNLNPLSPSPLTSSLVPFNFPTGSNGYAICNSDEAGNQNFPSMTNATLSWNGAPIDCSNQANVSIRFRTITKNWASQYYVRVSTDDGTTWTETPVMTHITTNMNTANSELVNVNISNLAAGYSQVRIGFRYTADWGWFWAIDDIELLETPPHWLTLSEPMFSMGSIAHQYTKVPLSQINVNTPLSFQARIENNGALAQNTSLLVTHGPYAGASPTLNLSPSEDSMLTVTGNASFTIPPFVGDFEFTYQALSPNPLHQPNDALGSKLFQVTDYVMASDTYDGSPGSISGGFFGWAADVGDPGIGTTYEIFNAGSIHSVHVGIANVAQADLANYVGNELYVQLWKYDPVADNYNFLAISDAYILTNNDFGNLVNIVFNTPINVAPGDQIVPMATSPEFAIVPIAFAGFSNQGNTIGIAGSSFVTLAANGLYVPTPVIRLDFGSNVALEVTSNNASCVGSCDGEIQVTATGFGASGILNYQWYLDGQLLNNVNGSVLQNACAGDYTVVVSNSGGNTATASITITEPTNLNLEFEAFPTIGLSPLYVVFQNQTPSLAGFDFHWDFGDGNEMINNNEILNHTYINNGSWDVTLTASNSSGCVFTLTKPNYIVSTDNSNCSHLAQILQPSPVEVCPYDIIELSANTSANFIYQWFDNGMPIVGATQATFSPTSEGTYSVQISENNCPVMSSEVTVIMHPVPETPVISPIGANEICDGGFVTLGTTMSYDGFNWSNGEQTETIQVNTSGLYSVVVNNIEGCESPSEAFLLNASSMDMQEICVVGNYETTNHNVVVWEKETTTGIDSFYVYRLNEITDEFEQIGAVGYNQLSIYVDMSSNTQSQSYTYRLSVLDTCGIETPWSAPHKTMLLNISAGSGSSWNLSWTPYEGVDLVSYNIYRGTNLNDMTLLATVSNTNSYNDPSPPLVSVTYQIEAVNDAGCDPTRVYSSAKSNIIWFDQSSVDAFELAAWSVMVYPNPSQTQITIETTNNVLPSRIDIYDIHGRILLNQIYNDSATVIQLDGFESGVYFARVFSEFGEKSLRFVKQ